ncbi:HET-domain-containing protein [Pyrenophora tritici-repentis]|nr:Heterokaryon incompatibility protein [Pyrenophora tritici-repentis]KAI2475156.1 HET-domain-containing protein [Pyrenophora tritici-repentis]KAI2475294.1 HET-domain-containing protein [Pyrenophora tritici-repentis]
MRFLRHLPGSNYFSLVERFGKDIPPYAILSHTWGSDEDEVTYKELRDAQAKRKSGYSKPYFCSKQAAEDELEFFWVDTCCIDKSSSAELSEAINSMFKWYQQAERCYVLLSDVTIDKPVRIFVSVLAKRYF